MALASRLAYCLFIALLYFFFRVEFKVEPHLPGYSTLKLLPQPDPRATPKQVVFILIDALRSSYRDRLPFIGKYSSQHPNSTFLTKMIAGSPTMTSQRVESLATGSEIFSADNYLSSFVASKVKIDNIIRQVSSQNKSSMLFGDSTWTERFDFEHDQACPNSFDISDLDTCDKIVYAHLSSEVLTNGTSKYHSNLIIAHLLGIDHVGHSFQRLDHPLFEVKFKEISSFIEGIVDAADDGVMFLFVGDHGMTTAGTHGGNSDEQRETLLFGYFKGGELSHEKVDRVVTQSDLTTTLSILLDVPIPKNVIGVPVLNLLPVGMSQPRDVQQIHKNTLKDLSSILEEYKLPLSEEQKQHYTSELAAKSSYQQQQQLLREVADKLTFLQYTWPNFYYLLLITVLFCLLILGRLVYGFQHELSELCSRWTKHLFMMIAGESFPMWIPLIFFFSWTMVLNLMPDAFILSFAGAVAFGIQHSGLTNRREKWISFLKVFIPFVVVCQIEYQRIPCCFRAHSLRLTFINYILSTKWAKVALSLGLLVFYAKTVLKEYLSLKSLGKPGIRKFILCWKAIIAAMTFANYILTHALESQIYPFTVIHSLAIIGLAAFIGLFEEHTPEEFLFLVVNYLSAFMGPHFPVILVVCLLIEREIAGYINYAAIMGLLAKCIWWWIGNRYQISGLDVRRTYVYSQYFSIYLNSYSFLVYLSAPFILNLTLMNCRLFAIRPQIQQKLRSGKSRYEWRLDIHPQQTAGDSGPPSSQFREFMEKSNLRFAGLLMLAMMTAVIITITNNGKLLFLVGCVPLLLMLVPLSAMTLGFMLGLSELYNCSKGHQYQQIEQQSELQT